MTTLAVTTTLADHAAMRAAERYHGSKPGAWKAYRTLVEHLPRDSVEWHIAHDRLQQLNRPKKKHIDAAKRNLAMRARYWHVAGMRSGPDAWHALKKTGQMKPGHVWWKLQNRKKHAWVTKNRAYQNFLSRRERWSNAIFEGPRNRRRFDDALSQMYDAEQTLRRWGVPIQPAHENPYELRARNMADTATVVRHYYDTDRRR